jgi:hypothetical protein
MTEEPVFLPAPEGAEHVIVAARHRRRRKVGAFASSVAFGVTCVLGVVALSGSTRNGAEQLIVTDSSAPTPAARASSSPVPNTPSAPVAAGSHAATAVGPTTASSDGTVSSPPPASPRSTARRTSPIYRSTRTDTDTTDLCSGGSGSVADWCVRTVDPGQVHRGTSVTLRGELCRLRPSQAATVTFSDTREATLEVSDGSAVEWQGGEGIRYRSPGRTVTVQPGTCLVWSSVWDTRDRDGFLVPPGTYDFSLSISMNSSGYSVGSTMTVVD